jgi:hypothetical protein
MYGVDIFLQSFGKISKISLISIGVLRIIAVCFRAAIAGIGGQNYLGKFIL